MCFCGMTNVAFENEHSVGKESSVSVDKERIKAATRELLLALGENPDREGLSRTPERVAEFWSEFIDTPPGVIHRTFSKIHGDQIVYVADIHEWSICEHHVLPMLLEFTLGYQTDESILGLSKLVRVVRKWCRGLQIQEQIADGILQELKEASGTEHAGVYVHGVHLCMLMRGVKSGAVAITSACSGRFKDDPGVRSEFLEIARNTRTIWPP